MEEAGLIGQLGINWKLFLSQAVNFFILLTVLWAFVYKPLMKAVKERTEKIKTGLEKAEEADIRLKEIDNIGKEKIKEAEQESIKIIKATENKAKVLEKEIQQIAEQKQQENKKLAEEQLKKQLEENKKIVLGQAAELIKRAVIKTVELDPKIIDDKLIEKAIFQINNEK